MVWFGLVEFRSECEVLLPLQGNPEWSRQPHVVNVNAAGSFTVSREKKRKEGSLEYYKQPTLLQL